VWNVLAREAAKRIGGTIAANKIAGIDEANGPEVYADRIKRDFHLHDYADAWALYDSDRAYWRNYYHPRPNSPAWSGEFVRDSVAAAGIPSRNNVFEHGFPESNPERASITEVSPVRMPDTSGWRSDFVRDSAAGAGVAGRNNVFEYGFPESGSAQEVPSVRLPSAPIWRSEFVRDSAAAAGVPSRNNAFEYGFPVSDPVWLSMGQAPSARRSNTQFMPQNGSTPAGGLAGQPPAFVGTNPNWPPQLRPGDSLPSPDVFTNGVPPVPFLPLASQRVPRGLPAMLAELGVFDPSNSDTQPSGGLPGLFQEYLRNR